MLFYIFMRYEYMNFLFLKAYLSKFHTIVAQKIDLYVIYGILPLRRN